MVSMDFGETEQKSEMTSSSPADECIGQMSMKELNEAMVASSNPYSLMIELSPEGKDVERL